MADKLADRSDSTSWRNWNRKWKYKLINFSLLVYSTQARIRLLLETEKITTFCTLTTKYAGKIWMVLGLSTSHSSSCLWQNKKNLSHLYKLLVEVSFKQKAKSTFSASVMRFGISHYTLCCCHIKLHHIRSRCVHGTICISIPGYDIWSG